MTLRIRWRARLRLIRARSRSPGQESRSRQRGNRMPDMCVIVTGGAGFIGSHLADAFVSRGDELMVLDDLSGGRLARLDGRAGPQKGSATAAAPLAVVVASYNPDIIAHVAAQIDGRASVV